MATKNTRSGGKFGGTHTTLTETAIVLVDIADNCDEVTKISPGFIKSGDGNGRGERRVKIFESGGMIVLTVRQGSTTQEVRIVSKDPQRTKLAIARGARNHHIAISFGRKEEIVARTQLCNKY